VSLAVDVPADSAYVAGHFPGRPILPGVAQLALALQALGPRPVHRLVLARFRRLVEPPARLTFSVRETAEGAARIDVARDDAPVSTIEVLLGVPTPARDWDVAVASRRVAAPPAIESLLPHRAPMLFVDGIVGEADDGLTCSAHVPEGCAIVAAGAAPAIAAIEAAAQTAAVWEALRARRAGEGVGRMGFLVSARDVELHDARLPAGMPLVASARLVAHAGPLAHYRVEVTCEAHPVLRGTIGAYREDGALSGHTSRKQNH
jgi:predicted hotdog family 3-hydroxylacyl-ACP dehydratase